MILPTTTTTNHVFTINRFVHWRIVPCWDIPPCPILPHPYNNNNTHNQIIPTQQEAEIAGVWRKDNVKRDKILELQSEMLSRKEDYNNTTQDGTTSSSSVPTLERMATPEQKLDLWLVEGIQCILQQTECTTKDTTIQGIVEDIQEQCWKNEDSMLHPTTTTTINLTQGQWDELLQNVHTVLTRYLLAFPLDAQINIPIRDFYNLSKDQMVSATKNTSTSTTATKSTDPTTTTTTITTTNTTATTTPSTLGGCVGIDDLFQKEDTNATQIQEQFNYAVIRARIQLTLSLVEYLQSAWMHFTQRTDQERDRIAVVQQGPALDSTTIPQMKVQQLLQTSLLGHDRLTAFWDLMDHDHDQLLDQEQLQRVVESCIGSVQDGVRNIVQDYIAIPHHGGSVVPSATTTTDTTTTEHRTLSWRQRRNEQRRKRQLHRLLHRALKYHYSEDLQVPHRVRCCYAWANKNHQGNRIESVLVESTTTTTSTNDNENGKHAQSGRTLANATTALMGRKRYVELEPKISLMEFREVQKIHLPQMDRIGSEWMECLRDDLYVQHGQGRQRRELMWDCGIFFTVVCLVDYVIMIL